MRLVELRKKMGISQSELARRSGLTGAAISKIEKGGVDPVLSTIIALSGALNTPIDVLVGVAPYPTTESMLRVEIAILKNKLIQIKDVIKT